MVRSKAATKPTIDVFVSAVSVVVFGWERGCCEWKAILLLHAGWHTVLYLLIKKQNKWKKSVKSVFMWIKLHFGLFGFFLDVKDTQTSHLFFFCLFFCGINTFASRLHDEDRKLWVPTDTPRVENHCLRLAEGNAEVPPTELHVNKHKLGMRRLSNGGLSFPLGLNDAWMSVLAPFWCEEITSWTTHDVLVSTHAPPQTFAVYFAGDEANKVSKLASSCWLHVSFKQKAAWQIFFFPESITRVASY